MIIKPTATIGIDAYPDADFAGLYGYEDNNDPVCVRNRMGMSLELPDAPSFGRPNFKPRQPLPPWKQRSLPWEVVAANSCPSLPLLMKLVLPLILSSPMTTTPIPALCTSLFTKTIRAH